MRVAGGRFRLHLLAASSPKGQLEDRVREGPATAEVFQELLEQIAEETDRKILLVVDHCSIHRARVMQEWLAANQAAAELYSQPTCSPQVNPMELLGALVKRRVSRDLSKIEAQLRDNLEAAFQSWQGAPEQVRAFFREADCQSILACILRTRLLTRSVITFSHCADLLGLPPVQAKSRADLRAKLAVESGGVVFTTIQKFFLEQKGDRHPLLADRRNIVVIADEAHRSRYDFIDGYARHMRDAPPNASFIGFTGTPIELGDASTRAVFGDHISIYDIQRAVADEATVPIYYESRLAKLVLDEVERPQVDIGFEEVTEGEDVDRREKLKTKWAQLEAIVGAEKHVVLVDRDIVAHFERRQEAMDGKALVVCMSRRICIDLYRELVRLRPAWRDDDTRGALKVVMTGQASDPLGWQAHIGSKAYRETLAKRFRDPDDPLRMVLVRDMWLTGFDAASLHTMYVDKPMRGHGLMQAIARVNRVFRDNPGGLVVDYLGLAHDLKRALATYTESGGTG